MRPQPPSVRNAWGQVSFVAQRFRPDPRLLRLGMGEHPSRSLSRITPPGAGEPSAGGSAGGARIPGRGSPAPGVRSHSLRNGSDLTPGCCAPTRRQASFTLALADHAAGGRANPALAVQPEGAGTTRARIASASTISLTPSSARPRARARKPRSAAGEGDGVPSIAVRARAAEERAVQAFASASRTGRKRVVGGSGRARARFRRHRSRAARSATRLAWAGPGTSTRGSRCVPTVSFRGLPPVEARSRPSSTAIPAAKS